MVVNKNNSSVKYFNRSPVLKSLLCSFVLIYLTVSIYGQIGNLEEPMKATPKEVFDHTYDMMIEISIIYTDRIQKTLASLLIVIGWFITSVKTQTYLSKSQRTRIFMQCIVVVVAILDISSHFVAKELSHDKLGLLKKIGYMDLEYYQKDAIPEPLFIINAITHLALFLIILVLIGRTKSFSTTTS